MTGERRPWVVGVSGASGTPYAAAVLRGLMDAQEPVDLIVSRAARLTLLDEQGLSWNDGRWEESARKWLGRSELGDLRHWGPQELAAGPSSGSYPAKGMAVVPASTDAVAAIALGLSKDLLQRAATVTLKEGRRLVVVAREMPLTTATLQHLVELARQGAVVAPASPAFYSSADTVERLVDFVAGKILDAMGVQHELFTRWQGRLRESD